ncbi:MAG: hypothetical protein EBU90_00810 [Proteobacteria bacterium]|nr:hypothetical protein [Pseudomonadota bacterium]NBP12973.1 hypothetical protein [bacterium]
MGNLFANQDIDAFFQTAINRDFARQNLFRVLYINSGATNIVFDQNDLVYVTSTSLPQRAITNISVPFMGLKFNVPGTATYPGSEAWNVTFRMPQDLGIRQKLELWTRGTFDDATSTGAYEVKDLGGVGLALMGKGGQVLRVYNLVGAYCTNIGQYTLNSTTAGEIVELQATIAYQFWIQPEASPIG